MTSRGDVDDRSLMIATLKIPDQQTARGQVPLYVSAFKVFHHRMDLETMEDDSHLLQKGTPHVPLRFNLDISHVVGIFSDDPTDRVIFDGLAHQE